MSTQEAIVSLVRDSYPKGSNELILLMETESYYIN